MRTRFSAVKLIIALAIPQLAGLVGSLFTSPAIPTWYAQLQKPWFTPPSWAFPVVWTTLYILMGISLYLVWNRGIDYPGVRAGLIIFGIQLALNAAWSFLFFGLQSPLLGLIGIVVLWVAIALTIYQFAQVSRTAAALLIPYIIWVSIALALNYSVWMLNP
jgi:translocator protein